MQSSRNTDNDQCDVTTDPSPSGRKLVTRSGSYGPSGLAEPALMFEA